MAFEARSQENAHSSVVLHPETFHASDSSDIPTAVHPATHWPEEPPKASRNHRPSIPALSIRPRTLSTVSSSGSGTPSPVKRKPLPLTASPLATRYSSGEHLVTALDPPDQVFTRPYSVDSPTLYEFPQTSTAPFTPSRSSTSKPSTRTSRELPAAVTSDDNKTPAPASIDRNTESDSLNHKDTSDTVPSHDALSKHARLGSESALTSTSESTGAWFTDAGSSIPNSATMSIFSAKPTPPHKINVSSGSSRTFSQDSIETTTPAQKSPQKSPGASKLGSFFGWGGNISPVSSRTSFSEKAYSPIPSPQTPELYPDASKTTYSKTKPTAIDVPKANAETGGYFGSAYLQLPLATPTTPIQVEEMEKELKDISSELASSIRREMDLEDLVERLQTEAQTSTNPGRRTSDYFSDSGTSSVRYGGDSDAKQDDLERAIRKTEQEKAQIRLELTSKLQDERMRRKQLERQIHNLEEKASHVDLASMNSLDAGGRVRDLELTCEDLRRRLAEERQVKDNFEDLLTALKGELQSSHNERDNLRDEIVPQLRARVEGLEAQAAQHEKLSYDQTKMQQELQNVKKENLILINAQRQAQEMQQQMTKFESISEEPNSAPIKASKGLSRSNSLAHPPSSRSRPSSLSRSASVKTTESREALAERVKDVELQRDALHAALKSLLERQEHQNRENQKKIRQLEAERDRALSSSPRRLAYDKEVAALRQEINTLRRRADDAIEQKWQCEKGLSGLKMDLDRAEQEIGSLRSLLQENDILIPTGTLQRQEANGSRPGSSHVSSESLERAYVDLQKAYAESLERLKTLELSGPKDEETEKAMSQLQQSLAAAISERDFAQQDANGLREEADSLRQIERTHLSDEQTMANELTVSAKRIEDLAIQVRQQLSSNNTLRERLSETIERGEKDQKTNAQRIMFMQSRLKSLEDQLMAAQLSSEESISRHEDEIRELKENHNTQLQRMKDGMRSPRLFAPKSPMSPMFANSGKSPRISSTTSGKALSVSEDSKMDFLKQRVMELETALADADKEMEEVVGRMNIAQIEVMELQNEREEAVRESKRLQKAIEEERIRAFQGRFATLSS